MIDLIKPIDEWGRQNAENEPCETRKKLVHKLKWTLLKTQETIT